MNISNLIANLAMNNETERIYAADDLGEANAAEAILPLMERLAVEPSRKVRESIFLALERIDSPAVPIVVAALLESDDAFLRNQAVGLLQRKGAAAVPALLARMHDADPDVRKFVLDAAAGISFADVGPIYDAAVQDRDANVLIAALEYLAEQRQGRFKPAVESIFLKATEPMLVCAAFAALLQIGDAASWQCILQRYPTPANVPSWELGWWLRALGDFGAAGELEVFHGILRSHDGNVARDTIDALERFQVRHGRVAISEEFWKTLRELLRDTLPPEDKLQLLRVLGGFGAPAGIGDFLIALLDQSDRVTKLGAIEGIKRLGRPDLMARLRDRCHLEADPEIAEALAECGEDSLMTLALKDFGTIRDEVYRQLGLYFEDSKVYFIQKRLEKRMEILGMESFADYAFLLRFGDKGSQEMQALANLVTTNETYMFREFEQLQAFADHCLPMVLKPLEAANDRRLRIWSAGCSSGEEPYTLAMILKEVMHDCSSWDIKIKATDIDQVRLEMARRAVYDERSVKEVPADYFDRHLLRLPAGYFGVKPETAKLVEIEHLNLSDRMAMRGMRQFDFVFCRNVLIYFDDTSRKAAVDHFYNALRPGGFIFLGHSESIGRISTAFKLLRVGPHLVYRKE